MTRSFLSPSVTLVSSLILAHFYAGVERHGGGGDPASEAAPGRHDVPAPPLLRLRAHGYGPRRAAHADLSASHRRVSSHARGHSQLFANLYRSVPQGTPSELLILWFLFFSAGAELCKMWMFFGLHSALVSAYSLIGVSVRIYRFVTPQTPRPSSH